MPPWISDDMPSDALDEITCPFRNLTPPLYNGCNYLFVVGLKLNHVNKMGPEQQQTEW